MLCGGVGGARAALALYENAHEHSLTFIVNTGDDFTHLGLEIWPDWDTVFYHLAGLQDSGRGWGRADEGTRAMEELKRFGAPDWFHLGDRDLALHVYRTALLKDGWDRARVADHLTTRTELRCRVLPVSESGMDTKLQLENGSTMDFQPWFVKEKGEPRVSRVLSDTSVPLATEARTALEAADLLVMAPSNPYLSLGPMLGLPELSSVLKSLRIPKLAVSPLVGGKAVKGPLDRLIASLSAFSGQRAIAEYWSPWVDALILPPEEAELLKEAPVKLRGAPTMLSTPAERAAFCHGLLAAGSGL